MAEPSDMQREADTAGRKAVFFGLGALALAGMLGWMIARITGGGPEMMPVVVAAEDIAPLAELRAKQLRVVPWPAALRPGGTFASVEDVTKVKQLSLNGMLAGEAVLAPRLSTPERGLGVSQLVEPNMRAFVVQVAEIEARSRAMHPGAFVDVVATLEDSRTRETLTKVILQNVQIIAVGDSVDIEVAPADKPGGVGGDERAKLERGRVVTLLVNPSEVEPLAFAAAHGKIDLALRSNVDSEIVNTAGYNSERMFGSRAANINAGVAAAAALSGGPADLRPPPARATRPRATRGAFSIRR